MTATLRGCIVAQEGYTFLSLDASQLELRVAAILCQDPAMLEDVKQQDLHLATAIRVFGLPTKNEAVLELGYNTTSEAVKDWITRETALRRYNAKQLNFAILYGATASKIAEMAGVTIQKAEEMLRLYFKTYPILKRWIDKMTAQAKIDKFVVSMFGRIRPIPEFDSPIWSLRSKAEREAVNTLVQGTAIDIVKLAMLQLRQIFDLSVRMVLNVHDEILFEVPDPLLDGCIKICKEELPQRFPEYPFTMKVSKCYGALEKVK